MASRRSVDKLHHELIPDAPPVVGRGKRDWKVREALLGRTPHPGLRSAVQGGQMRQLHPQQRCLQLVEAEVAADLRMHELARGPLDCEAT